MMATFLLMIGPARRGLRGADRRGAGHRVLGTRRPTEPVTDPAAGVDGELRPTPSSPIPAPRTPVLRDINLTARPGQTTAIIGSTGAGKSTLISLIPRLFDATGGAVAVDGVDVRDMRSRPAVEPDRAGAAEAVPVLRHGGQQPALRQPGRHRRGALARAAGRPGRGLRPGHARPAGGRRSPRAAPTSPAASGSGSPSPARWSSSRRSTSSTTRSPRSTWPPTPGCGRRSSARPPTGA